MTFRVKFSEQGGTFKARFGETHNVSDGGYERGYEVGYKKGYSIGFSDGGQHAIDSLPVWEGGSY